MKNTQAHMDEIKEQQKAITSHIADIHVRSIECFQRAFAEGEWGTETRKISTIAESSGALLAMYGDSGQNFSAGWIVTNGVVERSMRNRKRDLGKVISTRPDASCRIGDIMVIKETE